MCFGMALNREKEFCIFSVERIYYREIHYLTREFHVKLRAKTDISVFLHVNKLHTNRKDK